VDEEALNELTIFFKALIDPNRLAIAGRLAASAMSLEAIAGALNLPRIDVQHHLERLTDAGLVRLGDDLYTLDRDEMHARARKVLSAGPIVSPPPHSPEKVLADYLRPDGSLKDIPTQLKKKLIVYAHIVDRFEPGRRYTEKEVNETLKRFHPDAVSIRRDLCDLGFLGRQTDGSAYWRLEQRPF